MDSYELDVHCPDGDFTVKCDSYSAKLIYKPPTEEIKSHPKYKFAMHILEKTYEL